MAYGTLKCDNIVFDNGGVDKLITVSGLFYSTSGALTVTGTISGGNVTAPTATFTTLTGTTTAGTTATFTSGSFTSLTGVTTTGTTATFTSGSFTSLTGVTTTVTSGVFSSGIATAPSVAIGSGTTYKPGIYSPGADQVGISTGGTGRVFVDGSGNVGVGVTLSTWGSPQKPIEFAGGSSISFNTGAPQVYLNSNCYYNGTNWIYKTTGLVNQFVGNPAGGGFIWNNAASGTAGNAITFTQSMTLDANGRLGIGTPTPGAPLEVVGSTSGDQLRINQSGQFYRIGREGSGGLLEFYGAQSGFNGYIFGGANGERMRIDSSGRLLVGTSSSRANLFNSTVSPLFQVEAVSGDGRFASLIYNNNSVDEPVFVLGKSRSGSLNGVTIVASGDGLGKISFQGGDGSELVEGAAIRAEVDGTPGANDMPGRLVFSTTADGAASPTERYRITNDGVIAYNQPTPATYAAAATLTVADLKTGIITYTGGAATLTLPTGTLTEGGFAGIYTNMTFEWSVINTGAGICTIGAGTAHTIVGSGSVAIGASARFTSRRTAANTFVSYCLS